ncbi:hypothetical protein ACP4OV_019319 [Aristida adscensionis]
MAHEIEHAHLSIRGLNLHVAQAGKGDKPAGDGGVPARPPGDMVLVAPPDAGRGTRRLPRRRARLARVRPYGLSESNPPPPEHEEGALWDDLIADVVGVLDALSVPTAFVVGKDFGAIPAYHFAPRHPGRAHARRRRVPWPPRAPSPSTAAPCQKASTSCTGSYEPGRAEADFGRHDVRRVVRPVHVLFSGAEVPVAGEGQEIMDLAGAAAPLPEWLTEQDLDVYASHYERSGFRCALQMYRALHRLPRVPDARFQVPVFVVTGEKIHKTPLVRDGIQETPLMKQEW